MLAMRRETDYALQMIKLLIKANSRVLSLNDIAVESKISFLFLQKIARKLRLAKIIKAHQGVAGGYTLNVEPKKTSILKVIEAIEGQSCLLACLNKKKNIVCCGEKKNCVLKNKISKVNSQLIKILEKVKLSDI